MSEWYEPKGDEIYIEMDKKEVDIYVKAGDQGSVYITLTFDQIEEIHGKIAKHKP